MKPPFTIFSVYWWCSAIRPNLIQCPTGSVPKIPSQNREKNQSLLLALTQLLFYLQLCNKYHSILYSFTYLLTAGARVWRIMDNLTIGCENYNQLAYVPHLAQNSSTQSSTKYIIDGIMHKFIFRKNNYIHSYRIIILLHEPQLHKAY